MNHRLVKCYQGNKVWYEVKKFSKFNFIGKIYYGFDGIWEIVKELNYDDDNKAKFEFEQVKQDYINNYSDIKEEILDEF